LVKAGDKQNKLQPLQAVRLEKVLYGEVETKGAISNIVTAVVSQYKFASLPELNAVLQQYNVIADRGAEDTRMFEKIGLQYSLHDGQGNKIGKPILSNLENKYAANNEARQPFNQSLKEKTDHPFHKKQTRDSFTNELKEKGVSVVYRSNEQNFIYGITYADHTTKSVFNGNDPGKEYSAAAIQGRIQRDTILTKRNILR